MKPWHSIPLSDVEQKLQTTIHAGISSAVAHERLSIDGPNELPAGKTDPLILVFIRQFKSPLIYVLFVSAGIVYAVGNATDAVIIGTVLVFNAVIGAFQEGRAQNTLQALRKFAETRTTVLRDGKEVIIDDRGVVTGDIVILSEGEKIPADLRIVEARALKIDEASLTGESVPVHKKSDAIADDLAPLAERRNMAFKGTVVVSGNGRGIAVATGRNTEIGRISSAIAGLSADIPLARDIERLSRQIVVLVLVLSIALFAVGTSYGHSPADMFRTVVALAVSIIPEGLPLVLTIILATGVWRMAKRNALVKKLQAVEALGQASVIVVDKTGTLTKNELVVRQAIAGGKTFTVGGTGYETKGEVLFENSSIDAADHPELLILGKIAVLASRGHAVFDEHESVWRVAGDPTEAAMTVFGEKLGFRRDDLEHENTFIGEIPFDYTTKYHLSVHDHEGRRFVSVAGAPEVVLGASTHVLTEDGKTTPLHAEAREHLEQTFQKLSREGLRVVALAHGDEAGAEPVVELPKQLIFAGFLAMEDALRPEAPEAIRRAQDAGIRVVMITGDHKLTATAIAKQAGIWTEGDEVLTDTDLARYTEGELAAMINRVSVFARITPEHKMKLIQAYRANGEVVSMTGDGVNDAPSLVAADLGVAMGKIGTEVAKEAADIVLLDDNFDTIVAAIEEGRNMFKTIQKAILYLFSTSLGELLAILGAIVLGFPVPLLPAQILWLNLITDPFMGSALALEPKESGLLARGYRTMKRGLIDRTMLVRTLLMGLTMMVGTLFVFQAYAPNDFEKALTMSLTVLAVYQWWNAFNCRSERESLFSKNPFENVWLVWGTLLVVALQVMVVYVPLFQDILHTVPLSLYDWGVATAVGFSIVIVEEIRKLFMRRVSRSAVLEIGIP